MDKVKELLENTNVKIHYLGDPLNEKKTEAPTQCTTVSPETTTVIPITSKPKNNIQSSSQSQGKTQENQNVIQTAKASSNGRRRGRGRGRRRKRSTKNQKPGNSTVDNRKWRHLLGKSKPFYPSSDCNYRKNCGKINIRPTTTTLLPKSAQVKVMVSTISPIVSTIKSSANNAHFYDGIWEIIESTSKLIRDSIARHTAKQKYVAHLADKKRRIKERKLRELSTTYYYDSYLVTGQTSYFEQMVSTSQTTIYSEKMVSTLVSDEIVSTSQKTTYSEEIASTAQKTEQRGAYTGSPSPSE